MRVSAIALITLAAACSPSEPPHWPEGGAALQIPTARWQQGDDPIEIRPNGEVLQDGSLVFVIDRVGRVADAEYDPMAILLPDGHLVGTDDQYLGQLGVTNAAPPWSQQAWLSVSAEGRVVAFDSDGDRTSLGRWEGCEGAALRTCTLVTHLLALKRHRTRPSGPGIGLGIGMWL
ncbi:MAG: hypothetical protein QM756_23200 [Polyangiaceae bacterium]